MNFHEEFNDIDDEDDYEEHRLYNDVELSWKNYPSFRDIIPDKNSTFFVWFDDYEQSELALKKLKSWALKKFEIMCNDKKELDLFQIFSEGKKMASSSHVCNCLLVRFFSAKIKKPIIEYLEKKYGDELLIEVPHIERKFTIKDSKISGISRTGTTKTNEDGEPKTFMNFYLEGKHISKALLSFHAIEMLDCAPTILMFEVFPNYRKRGLGKMIIQGIERETYDAGFNKLRLENTKAIQFWRDLGYDIDIDEGEKNLDFLDFEN